MKTMEKNLKKNLLNDKISEIISKDSWVKKDSWIETGEFNGYCVSFDYYDSGKVEVFFDNIPLVLSVLYEEGDDFFLLHIDDFTGAYYKSYPADLLGVTLLEAAYKTLVDMMSGELISIHDLVEFLEEQKFEYSRY